MDEFLGKAYYKYSRYIIGGVFLLLISYSIYIRLSGIGEASFWIDEGFSSYSSLYWQNVQYHLHSLSQVLSFQIFGVSDTAARLPSVFFSVITIPLIYIICQRLFSDARVSMLASLLFCFSYVEIAWAQQARFYTLLQFLFCLNILSFIEIYKHQRFKLIIPAIGLLYISVLFHPLLFINVILFCIPIPYLFYRYNGSILKVIKHNGIIIISLIALGLFEIYRHSEKGITFINQNIRGNISEKIISNYEQMYFAHILGEFGWLYFMYTGGLIVLIVRKKYIAFLALGATFFGVLFVLSQKTFLFHTRYVFFVFPTIMIGGAYFYIILGDCIKNCILKRVYWVIIGAVVLLSVNIQITPQASYNLGYTSPQVDFKSAYKSIPDGANIISGFPTLCEWYYKNRGTCDYSLAVNITGESKNNTRILESGEESYTSLSYLNNLGVLRPGKEYYIVLDSLSQSGIIQKELLKKILENGEIHYNSGENYKNIIIIKLMK